MRGKRPAAFLLFGVMAPVAAQQPAKGTEGPDIRKQEPKGTEGPDIRKQEPKGRSADRKRAAVEL